MENSSARPVTLASRARISSRDTARPKTTKPTSNRWTKTSKGKRTLQQKSQNSWTSQNQNFWPLNRLNTFSMSNMASRCFPGYKKTLFHSYLISQRTFFLEVYWCLIQIHSFTLVIKTAINNWWKSQLTITSSKEPIGTSARFLCPNCIVRRKHSSNSWTFSWIMFQE